MPRRVLMLLLFSALVLAACKSTTKTAAPTGSTAVPNQSNQPSTLAVPAQAAAVPGCTVVSFLPTPDPTSLFPPISADDYTSGPLTATVKIIEYSDFQ